jgi:hypothetical protein
MVVYVKGNASWGVGAGMKVEQETADPQIHKRAGLSQNRGFNFTEATISL